MRDRQALRHVSKHWHESAQGERQSIKEWPVGPCQRGLSEIKEEVAREGSLDSLRGIAALDVVLSHALVFASATLPLLSPWIRFTPLRLFGQARSAVIFFFVLSGYVLALQLLRQRLTYSRYLVRRFCRIYLPFAVSILTAGVLIAAIGNRAQPHFPPTMTDWRDGSFAAIVQHLIMTGLRADIQMNGVVWSLIHEMRVSLIMPLLVAAMARAPVRACLSLVAMSGLAFAVLAHLGEQQGLYDARTVWSSLLMTVYFVAPFAIGVFAAVKRDELLSWFAAHPLLAWIVPIVGISSLHFGIGTFVFDLVNSLAGAWIILAVLANPRVKDALEHSWFVWLGKVSYSLYLFHLLVFLSLVNLFGDSIPTLPLVGLAIAVSLGAAEVMNRIVERPADALGKRLTRNKLHASVATA